MKIAVLGDIHSNLFAFHAVGRRIEAAGVDRVYSVGDIVGYYAHPSECVNLVRRFCHGVVAGNHDWGLIGRLDLDLFSPSAAEALQWSEEHLRAEDIEYLEDLPLTFVDDGVTVVHSMPSNPEEFPYVFAEHDMREEFAAVDTPITFVGHTHHPTVFRENGENEEIVEGTFDLSDCGKAIVNVGSIGQPRDGDPRAPYAIYDTETRVLEITRVEYDLRKTIARVSATNLPSILADRLRLGK